MGIRVPLCCRRHMQSMMILCGIGLEDFDEPGQDLLLSVGCQIGVDADNL